jgi:ubiquinone/menaquinone biosynthesis C-methylase UbiE
MTQQSTPSTTDTELKAKHRSMWAAGNYAAVAEQLIPDAGQAVADACRVQQGERVLDIAAGSGNAAIPAALAGGEVVATDLTPELLDIGRPLAEEAGVRITWETADAEALPYADGEFDVAMSCVGIMFAPHHQQSADELVRVVRPGGRIGLLNWTPEGFIGQMFATMKPYAPPPPPGAQPPPLWGTEEHVRSLLGDRVTDLSFRKRTVTIDRFANGAEFRDYFKTNYGPTIAVYKSLADQPERAAELDQALADLGDRFDEGGGTTRWEYLLVTGRRA